jgi:RimJ/RimL family protein N-acetyltransferase
MDRTPTLETQRLLLRPWGPSDLAPFAEMNADPEVMAHLPAPLSREESDLLARAIRDHFGRHGYGLWAIEVRGQAPFIGFVGLLHRTAAQFPVPFAPCVEVSWRLRRDAWGEGYATEAARAAVAHGFETERLDEIVSFTAPGNTRSRRTMERLGMRHDPTGDFDHPNLPEGHPLRRHVLYRLQSP